MEKWHFHSCSFSETVTSPSDKKPTSIFCPCRSLSILFNVDQVIPTSNEVEFRTVQIVCTYESING